MASQKIEIEVEYFYTPADAHTGLQEHYEVEAVSVVGLPLSMDRDDLMICDATVERMLVEYLKEVGR